jgi:hypothetical protein
MEAKEVLTHVSAIDKAIKEKLPPAHLIDLLTSLKKGVVATEKLLRVSILAGPLSRPTSTVLPGCKPAAMIPADILTDSRV